MLESKEIQVTIFSSVRSEKQCGLWRLVLLWGHWKLKEEVIETHPTQWDSDVHFVVLIWMFSSAVT